MNNRNDFLRESIETLGKIFDSIAQLPKLTIKDFNSNKTALVIIDMVNGFAREGDLKSSRIDNLIPEITHLSKLCDEAKIIKLAFADNHTDASPEFHSYPMHCVTGTNQAEIVDEIKAVGGYILIPKNSTNGFLEKQFQKWLEENPQIDTFIAVGDCTDICVQQFSVTLKTWFNMQNKKSRVIVPTNAVDTYDLEIHNGDLMHIVGLYSMMINGIEVVSGIE